MITIMNRGFNSFAYFTVVTQTKLTMNQVKTKGVSLFDNMTEYASFVWRIMSDCTSNCLYLLIMFALKHAKTAAKTQWLFEQQGQFS